MKNKKQQASKINIKNYSMLLAVTLWSGTYAAGKIAVGDFSTFTLIFLRYFTAALLIFPIIIKYEKDWKLKRSDIPLMLAIGFIGIFAQHVLFFSALKYTTATNCSLIMGIVPLLTAILSAFILYEKLKLKYIVSAIVSIFGIILILTNGDFTIITNIKLNFGDFLSLLMALCWSLYTIYSKKGLNKVSPLKMTTYMFLFGSLQAVPFMLILEKPIYAMQHASTKGWLAIIFMATLPSVLGYLLNQVSIQSIGASRTNLYMNLMPVMSVSIAMIVLKESITTTTFIASILIVSSVLFATYEPHTKHISIKSKEHLHQKI